MLGKVISAYLTLSYFFLRVLSNMQITEKEFNEFKGADPTTNCGCAQTMEKFCIDMMKTVKDKDATGAFQSGFPLCVDNDLIVNKNCGGGTTTVVAKIIVCKWVKSKWYYIFGKGKTPNHLMSYDTKYIHDHQYLVFEQEYPYSN